MGGGGSPYVHFADLLVSIGTMGLPRARPSSLPKFNRSVRHTPCLLEQVHVAPGWRMWLSTWLTCLFFLFLFFFSFSVLLRKWMRYSLFSHAV